MDWKQVDGQNALDMLIDSLAGNDAFIREAHLVSPSFVIPGGDKKGWTGHPDALPSLRMLVTSASESAPSMELLFARVEELSIWFGAGELAPSATWRDGSISWTFHKDRQTPIRSQSLYYRFLDDTIWGDKLRYGWESIFDGSGGLSIALEK